MVTILENTDLIKFALDGNLDVVAHGCNCFNTQKSGIAVTMCKNFNTNFFLMEKEKYFGDYNKLGIIDFEYQKIVKENPSRDVAIVNMYTQFNHGKPSPFSDHPADYTAIQLCFQKLAFIFKGKDIGMPYNIGCDRGGLNWSIVYDMIEKTFVDCNVYLCKFNPLENGKKEN